MDALKIHFSLQRAFQELLEGHRDELDVLTWIQVTLEPAFELHRQERMGAVVLDRRIRARAADVEVAALTMTGFLDHFPFGAFKRWLRRLDDPRGKPDDHPAR